MKVRIDSGTVSFLESDQVSVESDDLRVYYELPYSEAGGALHLRFTEEGLIIDRVEQGEITGTAGYTVDELEELCH